MSHSWQVLTTVWAIPYFDSKKLVLISVQVVSDLIAQTIYVRMLLFVVNLLCKVQQ